MDILNDYCIVNEPNPDHLGLNETQINEQRDYSYNLRKRKRNLNYEDFCLVHSDDLWFLWNTIKQFSVSSYSFLLNELDYTTFCEVCYNNTK